MSLSVAIIGASHKPQRFAYKAQEILMDLQHAVFPVSGNGREILGVAGYQSIAEIQQPIDTVTLYLNPQRHQAIKQDILQAKPRRIIFNLESAVGRVVVRLRWCRSRRDDAE